MSAGKEGGEHMQPKHALFSSFSGATFLAIASLNSVQAAPLLIVGNDEKLLWDDQGKPIVSPAGKDSVVNPRSRRSGKPEDRRQPAAEELDRRSAGQPRYRSHQLDRTGCRFDRRHQRR
jgi:hypothetical protein